MRLRPGLLAVVLAAALQAAVARSALAQSTASVQVSVDVSRTALSIGQLRDLLFGTVTPGAATVVDPRRSASAGMWEIHGNRRAEIAATFVLPDSLRVGPHVMPITFGARAGCARDRAQQRRCTYFDPSTTWVDRIRNRRTPNDTYYLWIGGTVTPSAGQFPGIYRGTITLTVAYTGN